MNSKTKSNTPYVYLIRWTDLDMSYIGCRYANKCKPEDLWVKYFTSSKTVKEFRKINGDPDHIEILKTFNSGDTHSCAIYERARLKEVNAKRNPLYLNKNNGNGSHSFEATPASTAKGTATRKANLAAMSPEERKRQTAKANATTAARRKLMTPEELLADKEKRKKKKEAKFNALSLEDQEKELAYRKAIREETWDNHRKYFYIVTEPDGTKYIVNKDSKRYLEQRKFPVNPTGIGKTRTCRAYSFDIFNKEDYDKIVSENLDIVIWDINLPVVLFEWDYSLEISKKHTGNSHAKCPDNIEEAFYRKNVAVNKLVFANGTVEYIPGIKFLKLLHPIVCDFSGHRMDKLSKTAIPEIGCIEFSLFRPQGGELIDIPGHPRMLKDIKY